MGAAVCPHCGANFNKRCKAHYHIYFEVDGISVTYDIKNESVDVVVKAEVAAQQAAKLGDFEVVL